ncbi:hypothetical protein BKA63DRAFT_493066 [Paraphoma chrysanthemicola]|nr:hypothetical protein BKA63DRAFT_493066 [Paraphoma chrysanthemicola]
MRSTIFAFMATAALAADVTIVWRHEKTTGSTSLSVQSTSDATVLAESCGNSIGSLDFSSVDEHGAGNFTIGSNTFDIISKSQDGVSCTRMYNGIIATVTCSGVSFDIPAGVASSAECFTDDDAKASFLALRSMSLGAIDDPTPIEQRSTPVQAFRLRGRQQCHNEVGTVQVGDGNPHQNYYHKQLSEVINCGAAPSCSAGYENSKSYTIGFSSGISADGWISAGFEVQKSWSTGNQYTCYGGPHDDVCIWYNTAHTAYTVRNWVQNTCLGRPKAYSDNFVMKSPNKVNRGGGMYCVIGTCRAQGDAYWDDSGRAGGP